jgi:hypothetical protein
MKRSALITFRYGLSGTSATVDSTRGFEVEEERSETLGKIEHNVGLPSTSPGKSKTENSSENWLSAIAVYESHSPNDNGNLTLVHIWFSI